MFALAGIVCCLRATCKVLRCCCQWDSRPTTAGSTSQRSLGAWFKESVDFFSKWFLSIAWDSDEAAFTQLYTACSREVPAKRVTGKYFVPVARAFRTNPLAADTSTQAKLWEFTEHILRARGFTDYEHKHSRSRLRRFTRPHIRRVSG